VGAGGPSDGLRVRVTDLRRRPGNRDEVHRRVRLGGLRVADAEVSDDPVDVAVTLESLSDGVRVQGTVRYHWTGSCRRCLGEAHGTAEAPVSELFADDPVSDEILRIDDGWVDLGDTVRDTVLLGLPLAPLCRDDCEGPAPADFPVVVEAEPGAGEPGGTPADPRWAALAELRFDPEEP